MSLRIALGLGHTLTAVSPQLCSTTQSFYVFKACIMDIQ